MRVRIRMIGAGTTDDPFRVNLPVYNMIDADYATGLATVDIPEKYGPPIAPVPGSEAAPIIGKVPTIVRLSPGELEAWQEKLSKQYPNHPANFRARAD